MTIDDKAAAFAKLHGSFELHFDASRNYVRPDDAPWTLILDSDQDRGWAGFTAEEALDFAISELDGTQQKAPASLSRGLPF